MIRSVAKSLGLGLLILGAYACGGDKPPPANPDNSMSASDAGSDMPSTDTASKGDAGATTASTGETTPPPPPAPAKLDLPAASAKFKLKGKDIEIKNDGTVNTAGKPTHKISGMELQDKDAKTLLKVDNDGNVTMADGGAYGKFEGDDMTGNDGSKLSAGDDGINQTDAKGKKTALAAKAEGIGSAKKATLLVVSYNLWGNKPPKAAAPKAGGDKPAGDKGKPAAGGKK